MNSNMRMGLISLVVGIVITLLTGLLNSTPSGGLIGATWYGYPTAWLTQLSGAQGAPWTLYSNSPVNLIIDIIFWTIIVAIVWYIVMYLRKGRMKPTAAPM